MGCKKVNARRVKKMYYKEFIDGINDKRIKQIDFYIDGYNHYKNCSVGRYGDVFNDNQFDFRIMCILTKDRSECVSFIDEFNENYKLFDFGRKGKFTLKEVWDKVVVTNIQYL